MSYTDFFKEFYICSPKASNRVNNIFKLHSENIFKYLTITELLLFSSVSKNLSNIKLNCEFINYLIKSTKSKLNFGSINLNFRDDLTVESVRKIICKIASGSNCEVIISKDGFVSLDISLKINLVMSSTNTTPFQTDDCSDDYNQMVAEEQKIQKFLEVSSVDDFDDFTPRHPEPKDRAHRRGDSYFNSDITLLTENVFNLSRIDEISSYVMNDRDEY